MVGNLFDRGVLPIGVAAEATGLRLAQLRRRRGKYELVATASVAIDWSAQSLTDPARLEELRAGLERRLGAGGFIGSRCVLSVPDELLRVRSVRQPRMPEEETDAAVRLDGAERLGFSASDPVELGWLLAGEARQGEDTRDELIVVGGMTDQLTALTEMAVGAGLRPVALEPAFVACGRAHSRMHRRTSDRETVRVVLSMSRRSTGVLVLRGTDVAFYKSLALGGEHLDQAAAERLEASLETAHELRRQRMAREGGEGAESPEMSPEVDRAVREACRPLLEQLASEAALCLRYYNVTFRGRRPESVVACGDDAREPGLLEALSSALSAPANLGRPLEGVELGAGAAGADRRGDLTEWSVAVGLSLRGDAGVAAETKDAPEERAAEEADAAAGRAA